MVEPGACGEKQDTGYGHDGHFHRGIHTLDSDQERALRGESFEFPGSGGRVSYFLPIGCAPRCSGWAEWPTSPWRTVPRTKLKEADRCSTPSGDSAMIGML